MPDRLRGRRGVEQSKRPDYRSEEAQAYRSWYKTARWQKLRATQLRNEPLCRICKKAGKIVPASVCDHIKPHKGDEQAFWSGPLQSLCKPCHDGTKQSIERGGRPRVQFDAEGRVIW